MIKKISEIYVREGVVFFYSVNIVSRYKNKKPHWRDQMEICISSKEGISKMLALVIPYLANKKRYAELMLETLIWVDEQPYRGRNSGGGNYTETDRFKELISMLEQERAFLIDPSTTTRRAREVLSW